VTATAARVLIVENDFTIAENLYTYLELKGFIVDAAYDGRDALALLATENFDAMILDIGLPGLDGYGVLQALRHDRAASLPVLVLTARGQLEDKLAAFSLGADDYLIKPFALAEVEARLRVMLRRGPPPAVVSRLEFAGIVYDLSSGIVTVNGTPVHLTRKSRVILQMLMRSPESLITREKLERVLWPSGPPSREALRSQMHLLRKALLEAGFDGIATIPGLGWRLQC